MSRHLFVTTHTPVLSSGRAVRTWGIARVLAEHGGLDLLYQRFEGDRPDEAFAAITDVTMHEVRGGRTPPRALAYLKARRAGVPASLARGISPRLSAAATRLAALPDRGLVVADGPIAAAALSALARARPVIYNAHNFESGFRHEPGMAEGGSPRELREFERGLLERASESWMVSHRDLAAARELCPDAQLRYMPNVVDVEAIEPVQPRLSERRAMFVANFAYQPNRSAMRFLLDEVMPRVWKQLPDAKLTLVGGGLPQDALPDDARIETMGFVRELARAYGTASCVVVPLLLGGGTPLKLVEALAYGMPILATSRAVAGLEVTAGEHLLMADGAEAFAGALVRLLRDGDEGLGARARALALQRYSIQALSELLPG